MQQSHSNQQILIPQQSNYTMVPVEQGIELIKKAESTNFDRTSSSESQFQVQMCHQSSPILLQQQNEIGKQPQSVSNNQNYQYNCNTQGQSSRPSTAQSESTQKVQLNSYVQKILEELGLCYEKLRANKQASSQTIRSLQLQLDGYKERNRNMIISNFMGTCDKDSLATSNSIETLEDQFQCTVDFYQKKIMILEQELARRSEENTELANRNILAEQQLAQANRVLRLQRQDANEKKREFKGMQLLILEYQNYISDNRDQVLERNQCIEHLSKHKNKLELQIGSLQKENQSLLQRIAQMEEQLKNKDTSREAEVNILTLQKQGRVEYAPLKCTKQPIQELNLKIEDLSRKLKETQSLLQLSKAKTINSMQQRMKQKMETKKSIYNIERIFKAQQRKKGRLIKQELSQLKKENERLKNYMQNELFTFFQDTRSNLMKLKIV